MSGTLASAGGKGKHTDCITVLTDNINIYFS